MERTVVSYDGVMFAPGGRFRVVRTGARLVGWQSMHGGFRGWVQELEVGDEIVCTGYGPGMGSDPGYGVEFTSEKSMADRASKCEFWPTVGGTWAYHPDVSFIETVEQESEDGQATG